MTEKHRKHLPNHPTRGAKRSSKADQRPLEQVDRAGAIAGIRRGLAEKKQGRARPAMEALEKLRRKHGILRNGMT